MENRLAVTFPSTPGTAYRTVVNVTNAAGLTATDRGAGFVVVAGFDVADGEFRQYRCAANATCAHGGAGDDDSSEDVDGDDQTK